MSVVEVERSGGIAVVRLNRPEARNAVDAEVCVRMLEAWELIRDDESIRVGVVTGTGPKAFCAGADLGSLIPLVTGTRQPESQWDHAVCRDPLIMDRSMLRILDPGKPLIAAVNGDAIAGGMELMLATDIRVSSTTARFGMQEVKWGVFPGGGSTVRLPRQIPFAHASELLLTGSLISAERALQLGLLNYCTAPEAVLEKALELAALIAANGPLAVRAVRRSIRDGSGRPEAEGLRIEKELSDQIFKTLDAQEGPRAFMEKRKPVFQGK